MAFKIADAYVEVEVDDDGVLSGVAKVTAELEGIPDRKVEVTVDDDKVMLGVIATNAALGNIPLDRTIEVLLEDAGLLPAVTEVREILDMLPESREVNITLSDPNIVGQVTEIKAILETLGNETITIDLNDMEAILALKELIYLYGEAEDEAVASAIAQDAAMDLVGDGLRRVRGPLAAAAVNWTFFGVSGLTALHWIIAGTAEFLAVTIPALVAGAAWAFVWLQGATNVYEHLQAVFGATEALGQAAGQTTGNIEGLSGAFQAAQNAANPDVYQVLGAAILILKEHFSNLATVGLQVGQIFDNFAAKLVYDFSAAGGAGTLVDNVLSRMVPDLVELGQIFGNLGHEILLLASQMPGLAEALLLVFDLFTRGVLDITSFLSKLSLFGVSIITAVIGLEEFMRWGGLLLGLLGAMGSGFDGFTTKFLTFTRFQEVFTGLITAIPGLFAGATQALADFAGRFSILGGEEGPVSSGLSALSTKIDSLTLGMGLWQAALVAVAAVGLAILIDKLVTAQSAAQVFADKLQNAAVQASNLGVLNVVSNNVAVLHTRLNDTNTSLADMNNKMVDSQPIVGAMVGRMDQLSGNAATYNAALKQQADNTQNVIQGALLLSNTYHISLVAAMELASAAGVKLVDGITGQGEAAVTARLKIADLVQGYESMGAPINTVGNDILALGIQSGLAGTKVSGLEQAWQEFMTNLTGGTTDLADFEAGLKGIQTSVASVRDNLSAGKSLSASISEVASLLSDKLTPNTTGANTAWQNFNQVVGETAPQMVNWFQTAGAEGAISGKQFTEAVSTMIAQLLPFAADSTTATAELSGLAQMVGGPATDNFQTLKGWVDQNKVSTGQYNDIVDKTTIAMSNMSQIAQNLGTVLQSEITNMMDTAKLATSGADGAINTYTKDLENNTQNTDAGKAARAQLISDFEKAGLNSVTANADVKALTQSVVNNTNSTNAGHAARNTFIGDLGLSGTKATDAKNDIDEYTTKILANSTTTAQGRQDRLNLIADLEKLGVQAGTARTDVDNYTAALKGIPKGEETTLQLVGNGNWTVSQLGWALTHPAGSGGTGPPGFASGRKIPGFGGGDIFPALLEPGETVVSKEHTQMLSGLFKRIGVPGFASGGATDVAGLVSAGMAAEGAVGKTIAGEVAAEIWKKLASVAMPTAGISGNVKSYAPDILAVLSALRQPAADLATVEAQMTTESGGNPDAVNKTDINWQEGHPSVGLMQVIEGTFDAYAGPYRNTGPFLYGVSTNPMANIYAGLNYAISRYGPGWTSVLGHGHGYAGGGIVSEPVVGMGMHTGQSYTFAEEGPETIVPGVHGRGGTTINFYGTQWPTNEQVEALSRKISLQSGVGP